MKVVSIYILSVILSFSIVGPVSATPIITGMYQKVDPLYTPININIMGDGSSSIISELRIYTDGSPISLLSNTFNMSYMGGDYVNNPWTFSFGHWAGGPYRQVFSPNWLSASGVDSLGPYLSFTSSTVSDRIQLSYASFSGTMPLNFLDPSSAFIANIWSDAGSALFHLTTNLDSGNSFNVYALLEGTIIGGPITLSGVPLPPGPPVPLPPTVLLLGSGLLGLAGWRRFRKG